ncbi:hypothetical protein B484DRAFT_100917 [Ochromonadaceae sp. CCMP2298]|nr:hypothetical protein B484DRAFT_100917 [Ochromonadaceae sp. CCMP2298]
MAPLLASGCLGDVSSSSHSTQGLLTLPLQRLVLSAQSAAMSCGGRVQYIHNHIDDVQYAHLVEAGGTGSAGTTGAGATSGFAGADAELAVLAALAGLAGSAAASASDPCLSIECLLGTERVRLHCTYCRHTSGAHTAPSPSPNFNPDPSPDVSVLEVTIYCSSSTAPASPTAVPAPIPAPAPAPAPASVSVSASVPIPGPLLLARLRDAITADFHRSNRRWRRILSHEKP